jgi:hypothetical protein
VTAPSASPWKATAADDVSKMETSRIGATADASTARDARLMWRGPARGSADPRFDRSDSGGRGALRPVRAECSALEPTDLDIASLPSARRPADQSQASPGRASSVLPKRGSVNGIAAPRRAGAGPGLCPIVDLLLCDIAVEPASRVVPEEVTDLQATARDGAPCPQARDTGSEFPPLAHADRLPWGARPRQEELY